MTAQTNSAATARPYRKNPCSTPFWPVRARSLGVLLGCLARRALRPRGRAVVRRSSDAELAKLGLRRDQVIDHAFRTYIAI